MSVKYLDSLESAKAHLKIAKRMISIGAGLVGEKRVLAKALVEMQKSVSFLIDAFLYFDQEKHNITHLGDRENRAKLFFGRVSKRYLYQKQIECMRTILKLTKGHKNAHLEFVKRDKLVIFHGKSYEVLTSDGLNALILMLNGAIIRLPGKA